MRSIFQRAPIPAAQPGLYHYRFENGDEHSRVHLRLDADGRGVLIVNANRVMHLNPTAALMTFLILEKTPANQAVRAIQSGFQVSKKQAGQDLAQIEAQIQEIVRPDGVCPVHDLDLEINAPFSARPSAPYRMDIALTYRCNNECSHCYNARPRSTPELETHEWKQILDDLWKLGIPHIVFTGGEPTLRSDLAELVAHAQQNGQITGINTNGRRLSDPAFVEQLVQAGLDHVQITLESHMAEIHDEMVACRGAWKQTIAGIRNALDSRLYVMTNTTMLQSNSPFLPETLDFLAELGVPTIGLNALIYAGHGAQVGTGLREAELTPLLEIARQKTDAHQQRLIWYTPTQYCHFDPVQMDLGVKGCTAALYNMCIEPEGSVLPCQSYYRSLGNILRDPWESIWNHELALSLRERKNLQEKCTGCLLIAECGGGCPLFAAQNTE